MREILFRAWWKDGGGLVDQNVYVIRPNGTIEFPEGGWDLWGSDDSDLVVLEQFTGVVDKNGKKIFEGDILRIEDEDGNYYITKVWYERGGLVIDVKGCDYDCTVIGWVNYCSMEVIGNIHDNPELLEVK